MKPFRPLLLTLLTTALLAGCGKDEETAPAYDGTVTWTRNGQTYTSTTYSSAIVDSPTKFIMTGASPDLNQTVSLVLPNVDTRGAAVYDLRRGSVVDDFPVGALTLSNTSPAGTYNTLYGPASSNGTITVTRYDKAGQKIEGTFSFTGGPTSGTGASGNQTVTNGTFSFTRFR